MKVERGEYQQRVILEAGDPMFDMFLFNLSVQDGITTEKTKGPITQINDRKFEMKCKMFNVVDIDPFDFMFPTKMQADSFEVIDKTNHILSNVFNQIRKFITDGGYTFLILYKIEIGIVGDELRCVVRMHCE